MSKKINWIDFYLECTTNWRNTSFYRVFGRNCLIETIDVYDETVHRGQFQLSRNRQVLMEGQDEAV